MPVSDLHRQTRSAGFLRDYELGPVLLKMVMNLGVMFQAVQRALQVKGYHGMAANFEGTYKGEKK